MPGESYDRLADLDHTNPTERHGSTVAHPAQPWTATVHAFLRHFEAEGFEASPRVVGPGFDDAGNEVLTWLDGTIFAEEVWPDPERSLHDVGVLLKRVHEASRSFTPPPDAQWMPWSLRSRADDTVISHGNIAPWHVVFNAGRPAGLIGWEYTGPVNAVDEVAVTAWYCAQLFDDDVAERIGLPWAATRAEWFRSFLDGYGLPRAARMDLIDRILHFVVTDNGWYARTQGLHPRVTRRRRSLDAGLAVARRAVDPRTSRPAHARGHAQKSALAMSLLRTKSKVSLLRRWSGQPIYQLGWHWATG